MKSRVDPKYKTRYRVTNWREYERGLVRRGDVTAWLSSEALGAWKAKPSGRRGAQPRFSNLAIETALPLRLVFHLPLRQTEGFLRNNAAERALRAIAVGRKNWMFFQRECGGRTAAILFSLLKTAEAAGIDPLIYFRDILARIDRERDTAKLLPFAWKDNFAAEVAERRGVGT